MYVDRQTHEVRHGVKSIAKSHHTGPWDCTSIDKRMTFEGWEGFIAVQEDEDDDLWALYFDLDNDGLRRKELIADKTGMGRRYRMLEVQLVRRERPKAHDMAIGERVERIRAMEDSVKREEESALDRQT